MADEAPQLPPNPIFAAIFAFHTLLGVLGQAAVLAATSGVVHDGPWRVFVGGLGAILNTGAIALAVRWQGPRERAILEQYDPTRPIPPMPPAALLPLLVLLSAGALAGCSPAWKLFWKTTGIDAARCLAPNIVDAAGDALVDLLGQLDGSSGPVDYAAMGKQLAVKYGADAAICAVGKAWANLKPVLGSAPGRRAQALGWLVQHQAEWAK